MSEYMSPPLKLLWHRVQLRIMLDNVRNRLSNLWGGATYDWSNNSNNKNNRNNNYLLVHLPQQQNAEVSSSHHPVVLVNLPSQKNQWYSFESLEHLWFLLDNVHVPPPLWCCRSQSEHQQQQQGSRSWWWTHPVLQQYLKQRYVLKSCVCEANILKYSTSFLELITEATPPQRLG